MYIPQNHPKFQTLFPRLFIVDRRLVMINDMILHLRRVEAEQRKEGNTLRHIM